MEAEVIIVGCGPVGALAANLLGQYGISTLILEREESVYHLPRAAHFDGEVMRVFQAVGLHEELAPAVASCPGMDLVNAKGRALMRFRTDDKSPEFGHAVTNMFHQPLLEIVLRRGLKRFGCVSLRTMTQVESVTDRGDHVEVEALERGTGKRFTASAKYVLGCDGARSLTRNVVGAELEDLKLHQPWLVLDLVMKRDVGLPNLTLQVCDPRRPATIVPFPAPRRRWEFMLMPGDDPAEMVTRDVIRQLLRPWAGPDDYEIERAAVYTFHGLLAKPWRRGRVILLGDAAHQTPPFLGQGMCAGIRDAFNLCWKLERVLRGYSDDSLLDTYETERSPHVREVIELAIRLGRIIQSKNRAIGAIRNIGFKLTNLVGGSRLAPESVSALPLGEGFFDASQSNRATRTPIPQPWVCAADGERRRLDELLGPGFAVIAYGRAPESLLSASTAERVRASGIPTLRVESTGTKGAVVVDNEDRLGAWFRRLGADVVLLRPDHFPYGAYAAATDGICEPLEAALLRLAPPAADLKKGVAI